MLLPLAAVVAVVLIVTGCTGQPEPTTPSPPPYVDVTEVGPPGTPLRSGTYSLGDFRPRIVITVPRGWQNFHREDRFSDVARETDEGVEALFFQLPTVVYGPPEGESPDTPQAAVDLLSQNAGLTVSEAESVEIAGRVGLQVDLVAAEEDTQILAAERPLLGTGPTDDVRLAFFEVDEGLLVIGIIAPRGQMDDTEESLKPMVDSIFIEESP